MKIVSLGVILACLILIQGQGCSSGFDSVSEKARSLEVSSNDSSGGNEEPAPEPVKDGFQFATKAVEMVDSNLARQHEVDIPISAEPGFSGSIELSVDRSQLDQIDTDKDIEVSISPSSLDLGPGQSANAKLTINVKITSRSFANSSVALIATSGEKSSRIDVPLKVNGVWEVRMMGGNSPEVWDSPTEAVNIRRHAGGTVVRFLNHDTNDTHVIHGNGAVPHGPRNQPMAAAAVAGQTGGQYEIRVGADEGPSTGSYYCHNHEGGGLRRTINFNMDAPTNVRGIASESAEPSHDCKGD